MTSADEFIKVAVDEVGYLEKKSASRLDEKTGNVGSANYTKYGAWYGINPGAWCAMFVSWCADKAGAAGIIPRHASCSAGIEVWKKMGRWHPRKSYTPQNGDIIYFGDKNGAPAHVGIVWAVTRDRVYTIEGNTSGGEDIVIPNGGAVAEKNYSLTNSRILGYGSPDWPDVVTPQEMRYNLVAELPTWAQPDIADLVVEGYLRGDNGKLDLSMDMVRTLIICKRMIDGKE